MLQSTGLIKLNFCYLKESRDRSTRRKEKYLENGHYERFSRDFLNKKISFKKSVADGTSRGHIATTYANAPKMKGKRYSCFDQILALPEQTLLVK